MTTLADLMREVGLEPAWRAHENARPVRPMPRTMRPADQRAADPRLAPSERLRAYNEVQRATEAPRGEAYAAPRNQFAEAGEYALESTGLPSVRRSASAFASGDLRQGAEQGALGLLGVAGLAGVGGARAPRPARTTRLDLNARSVDPGTTGPEEALRQAYERLGVSRPANIDLPSRQVDLSELPDYGPRWRDSDKVAHYGDLLGQSEPPPILVARDSRNGQWDVIDGNHRLEVLRRAGRSNLPALDATNAFGGRYVSSDATPPRPVRPPPRVAPPEMAPVPRAGPSEAPRTLYHGSNAEIEWPLRPPRRPSFPEPTGVSLAETPEVAGQFGNAIYPVRASGAVARGEDFMARARQYQSQGMNSAEASARAQRDFTEAGYAGVRWETGERSMFDGASLESAIGAAAPRRPPPRTAGQSATFIQEGDFMPSEAAYAGAMRPPEAPAHPRSQAPDAGSGLTGSFSDEAVHTGGRLRSLSDNEGGFIEYMPDENGWRIHRSHVPEGARGQGRGVALYEELMRRAREAGAPRLSSDAHVSGDAQRVYDALRRRGHDVRDVQHPGYPVAEHGQQHEINLASARPDGGGARAGQDVPGAVSGGSRTLDGLGPRRANALRVTLADIRGETPRLEDVGDWRSVQGRFHSVGPLDPHRATALEGLLTGIRRNRAVSAERPSSRGMFVVDEHPNGGHGMRAAVRDLDTGRIYEGDNHFFAAEAAEAAGARSIDSAGGFVDRAGNYLTREEAAQRLGITHRARADAGDLERFPPTPRPDGGGARAGRSPPRPPPRPRQ